MLEYMKDDIGDKSVFMFNSLPDDDKKALLEKLDQQNIKQWGINHEMNALIGYGDAALRKTIVIMSFCKV